MSLRARLLAGMTVVSFVLVTAAVIIGRTTENNLVDRVDEQLAPVAVGLSRANGPFSSPVSPGGGSAPTQLSGAQIADGSLTVVFTPNVSAGNVDAPEVSIATATEAAR